MFAVDLNCFSLITSEMVADLKLPCFLIYRIKMVNFLLSTALAAFLHILKRCVFIAV